jgi:hypothetical protein
MITPSSFTPESGHRAFMSTHSSALKVRAKCRRPPRTGTAQWQNGCDRVLTAGERTRRRRWKLAQDAKRRGAISRPSSRRALFVRERLWGIRIGLASLPGRKIDAARQAPHDSRPGSRNKSGTMPAGLIGIDVPRANYRFGGAPREHTLIRPVVIVPRHQYRCDGQHNFEQYRRHHTRRPPRTDHAAKANLTSVMSKNADCSTLRWL